MTDVILAKPAPGVTRQISCEPGARFVIEFATEDSTLSMQGDDLVFSFDDKSEVRLTDYLKTYTMETAPDLLLQDGGEIDGKDFWESIFTDAPMPGNEAVFGDNVSFGTDLAMEAMPDMPDMVQPEEDPSVLSYMVTMQTTGT
ncbi:MAG: hypothetical protein II967_00250 [Deltaproteobacteria bacterium]|nr:hypothetical protein [Deltaproteobacteria bacterium]